MSQSAVYEEDLESGTPGIQGAEADATAQLADHGSDDGAAETKAAPAAGTTDKQTAKAAAALERRIAELEESERYWAKKAQGQPAPQQPAQKAEPDELATLLADTGIDEGTAAELLDEIGENGVAALQKRGVVTKSQLAAIVSAMEKRFEAKAAGIADNRVAGAKDQLTAEAKLLKDFPDLADEKSDLAKATAAEFAAMVAEDPSLKNSYGALRAAAKIAQKTSSGTAERMQRIAAQRPTRGASASEFDDTDVEITPEAMSLINAGKKYGLTIDSFRKHARRAN